MEPKCCLSYSEKLIIRPCRDGVETTSQHYVQFLKLSFEIVIQHSSVPQVGFCFYVFRVKFCIFYFAMKVEAGLEKPLVRFMASGASSVLCILFGRNAATC